MNKKIIKSNLAHASRSMGPHVRQVIPSAIDNVDPFVFLDHFGPIEKNQVGKVFLLIPMLVLLLLPIYLLEVIVIKIVMVMML